MTDIPWMREILEKLTRNDAHHLTLGVKKSYDQKYITFHISLAHHSEAVCMWKVDDAEITEAWKIKAETSSDLRTIYTKHVDGEMTTLYLNKLKDALLNHSFKERTSHQAFDAFFYDAH